MTQVTYIKLSERGKDKMVNEDFVETATIESGFLAVLCDGIGGENNSELASRLGVKSAVKFFESSQIKNFLERLRDVVTDTNDYIYSLASNDPTAANVATTLEIFYFKDNFVYLAHVGDSRVYMIQNRTMKQLTKDHSLIQKLVDEGYITLKESENHPNKNIMLKAIGNKKTVEPDLIKIKLNKMDKNIFFICSDGISNLLTNKEIERLLNKEDENTIATAIKKIITSRGANDDYSFVYIKI